MHYLLSTVCFLAMGRIYANVDTLLAGVTWVLDYFLHAARLLALEFYYLLGLALLAFLAHIALLAYLGLELCYLLVV